MKKNETVVRMILVEAPHEFFDSHGAVVSMRILGSQPRCLKMTMNKERRNLPTLAFY
jgi:hypothetical protein